MEGVTPNTRAGSSHSILDSNICFREVPRESSKGVGAGPRGAEASNRTELIFLRGST